MVAFILTKEGINKVDALVSSITNVYFGKEIYITIEEKAVAYLYFIIKDHPFTDGNKRMASLVFRVVCQINNLHPSFKSGSLDEWAVFIEQIQEDDHHAVIKTIATVLFS